MTNYSRLRRMKKSELAEELERIRKSPAFPYMDFDEWLNSNEPSVKPLGVVITASISIMCRQTNKRIDTTEIRCVAINDNETFFGQRYVRLFNMDTQQIETVPWQCFNVKEFI